MSLRSFRVRLALWYIGVLSLTLGGFALALSYGFQRTTEAVVDRELAARVERMERAFHGPRRPPRPARPPGRDRAPRDERRRSGPWDDDAERIASTWRPRFHFPDGRGPAPDELWDADAVAPALAAGRHYSTVVVDGERMRVLSAQVAWPGEPAGVVQFARSLSDYDRLAANQQRTLLLLLPLGLLAAGGGGLLLTARALRPLRDITRAAAEIGADDLSRRLPVTGHDELAELARTFNGMIARLQAAFEQQRRFTADASHELRTPLARIKLSSSMALAGEPDLEEYATALAVTDRTADAMARLIDHLLLLARADAGQLLGTAARLDARDVLRQAVAALPEPGRVTLRLPEAPVPLRGDAELLGRAIANLLENALRHTPADGRITLTAAERDGEMQVSVSDTGEGIPPEHLGRVTHRFHRVDPARARAGGGAGLGLAICESIVAAHGGRLELTSQPGEGTTATLRLPLVPESGDATATPDSSA